MRILKHKLGKDLALGASAVVMATALAACGSGASSAGAAKAAKASGKKYSIAYVPGATGVPFYTSLSAGMKAEATKLGMSYSYQGSPTFTPSDQTPVVAAVCTRHPSVLVISPTTPKALEPAVNTCMKAGIAVVTTDTALQTTSKLVTAITSTSVEGGKVAAEYVGKQLHGSGQVAILNISATATTQVERQQGFENEIKAKYPNIQVVAVQTTAQSPSASTSAFESLMLAHPGIKAVFSASGTGSTGVAAAFKSDGLKGKVLNVGYTAGPTQKASLESGYTSVLIAQVPTEEGMYASLYAHDYLTGKKSAIKRKVTLKNVLITSADAKKKSYQKYFYKV